MSGQSAISFSQIIGPGETLPVSISGQEFYFTVLTAPVFARASNGGNFCQFVQGQGIKGAFTGLEIQNPNSFPVVFQVFATPLGFVDRRLIANQQVQSVVNVLNQSAWTGPTGPDNVYQVDLPDISGQQFVDANAKKWIALSRQLFSVQTGAVNGLATVSQTTGGIAAVESNTGSGIQTPFTLGASGTFILGYTPPSPSTFLACNVYEIYQAVAPGFAGQPPN
ncbi:MAG TPA: hypothetical protein VH280_25705 [Verrucomicrobiae bacterium]|jgi:hypothetical protein|nr:hypothetical protein [Verrucomicrobiae bacterium]